MAITRGIFLYKNMSVVVGFIISEEAPITNTLCSVLFSSAMLATLQLSRLMQSIAKETVFVLTG